MLTQKEIVKTMKFEAGLRGEKKEKGKRVPPQHYGVGFTLFKFTRTGEVALSISAYEGECPGTSFGEGLALVVHKAVDFGKNSKAITEMISQILNTRPIHYALNIVFNDFYQVLSEKKE